MPLIINKIIRGYIFFHNSRFLILPVNLLPLWGLIMFLHKRGDLVDDLPEITWRAQKESAWFCCKLQGLIVSPSMSRKTNLTKIRDLSLFCGSFSPCSCYSLSMIPCALPAAICCYAHRYRFYCPAAAYFSSRILVPRLLYQKRIGKFIGAFVAGSLCEYCTYILYRRGHLLCTERKIRLQRQCLYWIPFLPFSHTQLHCDHSKLCYPDHHRPIRHWNSPCMKLKPKK